MIRLKRSGGGGEAPVPKKKSKRKHKLPSRSRLRSAEERLAELDARQAKEREPIERQLKALAKKRDQLAACHSKVRAAAELKVEQAREAYQAALDDWQA